MQYSRYFFLTLLMLIVTVWAKSQPVNDSPNGEYGWKRMMGMQYSKRVAGYVIFKSGEKVTGSLIVTYRGPNVYSISVNNLEQNLDNISHFGLNSKTVFMVNQSPDEMYLWQLGIPSCLLAICI